MDIIVYDFDKTIYSKETTIEFTKFFLKKNKRCIFKFIISFFKSIFYFKNLTKAKEVYYSFLNGIEMNELDKYIEEFWENEKKYFFKDVVKEIENQKNIVLISASPEFILKKLEKYFSFDKIIGTKFEINKVFKSKVISKNCKGKNKVEALNKEYLKYNIVAFYSDSISDKPIYDLAKNKYYVDKEGKIGKGLPKKKMWIDRLI